MELEKEVLELIEFVKEKMKEMGYDASKVFLNGNCGNLYEIFVKKFSKYTTPFLITYKDEPYHIVTKIGEHMYDINGKTDLDSYINYIKSKNSSFRNASNSDFKLKQLSVIDPILTKMKNMYKYYDNYDENFKTSFSQKEIIGVMNELYYLVGRFEPKIK